MRMMHMYMVVMMATLGMVAGCNRGQDRRDYQIAELHKEIKELRALVKFQGENTGKMVTLLQMQITNSAVDNMLAEDAEWKSNTYDRVSALEMDSGKMWLKLHMTNSAVFPDTASKPTNSAQAYKQYYEQASAAMRSAAIQPSPSATTKDGVPADVYDQIAAQALRRWPTDYDMQEFSMKEQLKAYKRIHP